MSSTFYGKYRGSVVDVQDPNGLGRIRARVPQVLHDVESGWALPSAPYAAPGAGMFAIPPVGANVWIEFEAGDTACPIWSGGWWGDAQVPAGHDGARATPPLKIFRSEQGLLVSLDDGGPAIAVSDAHGRNLVTLEVGPGRVTVKGAAKVVIDAPQVELVEGATQAVVLGDALVAYLDQVVALYSGHVHPSSGAPPAMPLPAVPQITSTRVTTG